MAATYLVERVGAAAPVAIEGVDSVDICTLGHLRMFDEANAVIAVFAAGVWQTAVVVDESEDEEDEA